MSVSDELFRAAMARLAGGVAIVTAREPDGTPRGMTATAVTSVSLDPPLVMACLDVTSRTHGAIESSGGFALNFLGAAGRELAMRFSTAAADKFAGIELRVGAESAESAESAEGAEGAPILTDALAWCECVVTRTVPAGDHTVFIGRVEHAHAYENPDERPLVYYRGRYRTLNEDPPEGPLR